LSRRLPRLVADTDHLGHPVHTVRHGYLLCSATETANRAWLLTRRDRADAIAEIRILVAHAEELADPTEFIDEVDEF
jgi:hypothetical protein